MAILCDLDGTLAVLGDRSPYDTARALADALNHPVANVIEAYAHQTLFDVRLILITGHEEKYRHITEEWFQKHGITQSDALYMRKTGDRRKDCIVKYEYYDRDIKDNMRSCLS